MSRAQGEKPEGVEEKLTGPCERPERTDKCEKAEVAATAEEPKRPTSGGGDLTIYLFGRTGREKEEWFRRFLLASRMKSEGRGGGLPGICKSGECVVSRSSFHTCSAFAKTHLTPHRATSHSLEHVVAQPSDLCVSLSLGTANPLK